jgi:queuine tRNA-ribosyltransferase
MLNFKVLKRSSGGGRRGQLGTLHGSVETPAFMPVGTYGAVRGVAPWELEKAGTQILLANSYHLALRPGAETISNLGGLHRFMGWNRPILTDSGGYQLFSLAQHVKVSERGAVFRSHLDGSRFEMTPERSVEIQHLLGVDIGMMFDALTGDAGDRKSAADCAARTLRWAERTQAARELLGDRTSTSYFAIMQGGLFEDLRSDNAGALTEMDFPGYAVGGLSVGEAREDTMRMGRYAVGLLPEDKPRYMMGMGTPRDLVELCGSGYDLFDCVIPTRNGRNNSVFVRGGTLALRNAVHAEDNRPVSESCECETCNRFSRAYLHHLAKRKEMLAGILASIHNIHFYQRLMSDIRSALEDDRYEAFQRDFDSAYEENQ